MDVLSIFNAELVENINISNFIVKFFYGILVYEIKQKQFIIIYQTSTETIVKN